jgi:hypothetical protein
MKNGFVFVKFTSLCFYFLRANCGHSRDFTPVTFDLTQQILTNGPQSRPSAPETSFLKTYECCHEKDGECLKCARSQQGVITLECGCTAEVCCCCLDSDGTGRGEQLYLPCGCLTEEQCCCLECDLPSQESEYEPEYQFECFYCNILLKDSSILNCTCNYEEVNDCLECKKAYFELLKTLPNNQEILSRILEPKVPIPEDYVTMESECTLDGKCDILQFANLQNLRKLTLEQAKQDTEEYDKVLIIGSTSTTPGIIQKVRYVETTNTQLLDLFKSLKTESEQVTKFYDYYDVLTFIDKSIAHINEFLDTFTFNISNNSLLLKKYIERVNPDFEKYDKLANEIECLLKKHHETPNESKIETIEEELTSFNKRIAYLKEQYDRYKVFRIRDYQYYNTMKFHKLTRLLKDLKNVRCKMISMKEEDIKKNAKYFKERFKTTVSRIYDNLCKCKEKERKILNFMFEVLEEIWVNTGKCLDKMEAFKLVLLEISCLIPTLDK